MCEVMKFFNQWFDEAEETKIHLSNRAKIRRGYFPDKKCKDYSAKL